MTYPSGATPPNYPPYPLAPQYPQFPQYPQYPAYVQYAPPPAYAPPPPWMPPAAPVQPPPPLRPLDENPRGLAPDRYSRIGAVVAMLLVVCAVVLASVAPLLVNHASGAVPSNWTKIYDAQPASGDGNWQTQNGCEITDRGLHVSQNTSATTTPECNFTPSASRDLTSQGFYFEAVTAPPADVTNLEDPVIAFGVSGSVFAVIFGQDGQFTACTDPCDQSGNSLYTIGIAGSWHTNGFTENTIALLYNATTQQVTVYANGQEAATLTYSAPPASRMLLSVAGSYSGPTEALFTHVRVFSATA